jgi:2-acylglycerol O-acyltransferase 2
MILTPQNPAMDGTTPSSKTARMLALRTAKWVVVFLVGVVSLVCLLVPASADAQMSSTASTVTVAIPIMLAVAVMYTFSAMVEWAPLNVPFQRRLQTLAMVFVFPPLTGIYCMLIWASLLFFGSPGVRAVTLVYSVWCFVDRAPSTGGWNIPWLKRYLHGLSVYKYAFDYFGASVTKTCDLDPSKNYVFAYHPHGIIGLGAGFCFGTGGAGFADMFPGLNVSLMSLKVMFHVPFYREWLMAHGLTACGKKCCLKLLSEGPGRSICLAVGGAREAFDAIPNKMELTLKTRKGFVAVAVQAGACLVPVLGYGENELLDQVTAKPLRNIQEQSLTRMSFFWPMFYGRGIFNYTMGLLPHRRPLNIVVGAPIQCPKMDDMSSPEARKVVDEMHLKYMQALTALYDKHKEAFHTNGAIPMVFK